MNINQMANDLKDIPQQKLIQYVQDPNSVVPQFLALAEIQRRKTLERGAGAGQPPQSTVAQDIMAQASQQGVQGQPGVMGQPGMQQQEGLPAMQRPQGVAALPSGMDQQAFAGGGIIAFAGDKKSDVEDPYADNEYMQRVMRNQEAVESGEGIIGAFTNPRNYNPVTKLGLDRVPELYQKYIGGPTQRFFKQSPEEQAVGFRAASEARTGERPTFVNRPEDTARDVAAIAAARQKASIPTTSEQVKKMMSEDGSSLKPDELGRYKAGTNYDESKLYEAERFAKEKGYTSAPTVGPKGRMAVTTEADRKAGKSSEDMYSKYEQMLLSQQADTKAARDQDKYLRLIEAGLGMMGGTSPYALTNIGQGSMGAIKGYAQDLAAARKEDAGTVKELMGLGLKREEAEREARKLSMQEKYYGAAGEKDLAMADFYRSGKVGSGAGASTKMDIAELNAVKSAFTTLQKSATSMGSPNYGKSPEELWSMAERMVKGGSGGGNIGPTVIPFSSLK
jgi:hypothetical protein